MKCFFQIIRDDLNVALKIRTKVNFIYIILCIKKSEIYCEREIGTLVRLNKLYIHTR